MENQCFFTTDSKLVLVNRLEDNYVTGSAIILRPRSADDPYNGYMYCPNYAESTQVLENAKPVNPDYLFRMIKILDINWKVCINIVKSGKLNDTGIHTIKLYSNSNSLCFGERYYISQEDNLIMKDLGYMPMLINPKYLDEESCNKMYNQINSSQTLLYSIMQQIVKNF